MKTTGLICASPSRLLPLTTAVSVPRHERALARPAVGQLLRADPTRLGASGPGESRQSRQPVELIC